MIPKENSIYNLIFNTFSQLTKTNFLKFIFQGPKDLVIRASPEHPPQILPIICNQLLSQLKVFITTHVHSSVIKGIPNLLKDFLPSSNCDSRTQANVCITLIWKNGT